MLLFGLTLVFFLSRQKQDLTPTGEKTTPVIRREIGWRVIKALKNKRQLKISTQLGNKNAKKFQKMDNCIHDYSGYLYLFD